MTNLLIKLFIKNSQSTDDLTVRSRYGLLSGIVGIICNLFLCAVKFVAGMLTSSIAITADAFNNLSDAGSSVVTLAGFKLADAPADEEHPFGHGRMEYIAGLIVALIIMLMGVELAKSSISKIIAPENVDFSFISMGIMIGAVCVKIWMYFFNCTMGKKINSSALKATAKDSLSDSVATTAVIAGMIIYKVTGFQMDGYAGLIVALFVLYTGFSAAKDTLNPLLGQAPEPEFVEGIEKAVLSYKDIIGVHDLIVHNYGPGRCVVSLHAEVPYYADILEIHDTIDNIERKLKKQFHCTIVIHMDPVITDNETINETQQAIMNIVAQIHESLTIHDFRMVTGPTHTNLIFDVVVPPKFHMPDSMILKEIEKKVKRLNHSYYTVINLERSFL